MEENGRVRLGEAASEGHWVILGREADHDHAGESREQDRRAMAMDTRTLSWDRKKRAA